MLAYFTTVEHKVFLIGSVGEDITLLNVVSSVNTAPAETKVLRILIDSTGGIVEVGNNIYDFLNSLKNKYRIITEQAGFIGSIATKLFLVGDERIAKRGMNFGIHNPWAFVEGDSSKMDEVSKELKKIETDLVSFYSSVTGLTEEAIVPLMRDTTLFDSETALKLNFATQVVDSFKIAANMKTKFEKLTDKISAYFNEVEDKPLNMVLELEDGSKVFVQTEDISKLEGVKVFTVDENGNPTQESAPDGEHKLKDGRVIKVEAGVITSVVDSAESKLEEIAGRIISLEERIISQVDKKLEALRAQIKTTHTPPKPEPESSKDDAQRWDALFKENKLAKFKKENPEEYARLHFAKWGKLPN